MENANSNKKIEEEDTILCSRLQFKDKDAPLFGIIIEYKTEVVIFKTANQILEIPMSNVRYISKTDTPFIDHCSGGSYE